MAKQSRKQNNGNLGTIKLTQMAHGAKALARRGKQTIFVAGGLPGETVRVSAMRGGRGAIDAQLVEVLRAAAERVAPRCLPADIPIANYQHIAYEAQLRFKQIVLRDQFLRIGKLHDIPLAEIAPNPQPWGYRWDTTLSPTAAGGLGYWSPSQRQVVGTEGCAVLHPRLNQLLRELDLELPDLIKLTLRVDDQDELLLAFEMRDAEPPHIESDLPVSVALVMPDKMAATLIGDPTILRTVEGHAFRISAGSFFHPSLGGALQLLQTVTTMAAQQPGSRIVECYSGVGMLTTALAQFGPVIAIERNADSVEDAIINLPQEADVSLYNSWVEDALPALAGPCDLLVIDAPADGVSQEALALMIELQPARIIYSSGDAAQTAADAQRLTQAGYTLRRLQPIDMLPQTYHIHSVGLWQRT